MAIRKHAMRAGETDIAETVDDTPFQPIIQTLSQSLAHIGNLDVDILVQNGTKYVLEMNARFGGQYPFAHLAGVNYPEQIIKWINNEDSEEGISKYRAGIRMCKDLNPVIISTMNKVRSGGGE